MIGGAGWRFEKELNAKKRGNPSKLKFVLSNNYILFIYIYIYIRMILFKKLIVKIKNYVFICIKLLKN